MIRRALLLTTMERHYGIIVNFVMVATVSRILSPAEIGIYAIGSGLITIAFSLREFASAEFLIQRTIVTRRDVRTSFTILLLLSLALTVGIYLAGPWLALFYDEANLLKFLDIVLIAGIVEVFGMPIIALLRRDMAFGTIAAINMTAMTVTSVTTFAFAILGFSFMSFAYAWLFGALVTSIMAFLFHRDAWIFKPCLSSWRSLLTFGGYNGFTTVLNRAYESLPQLVLGRVLSHTAVGLYNRANVVCGIPDRFILASVFSVAFPAFAAEVRAGRRLEGHYLRSISFITALYWPGLIVMALLAHPIVSIILGQQWLSMVTLVQIMAHAGFFWFPCILATPILLSVGAMRDNLALNLLSRPLSAIVLCSASFYGIVAMAMSQFITLPFQMALSLLYVRRHIPFSWQALCDEIGKAGFITCCTAAGPLAMISLNGFRFDLPIASAMIGVLSAALGWGIGLNAVRHPLLAEVRIIWEAIKPYLGILRRFDIRAKEV